MKSYTREFSLPVVSFATDVHSRAHRAANPSKFPIPAEAKRLYPRITDTAVKYPAPTKVHLQVYDGCGHVLPILFAFTTPAKYCFRAIASFCRFATGMQALSPGPPSPAAVNTPGFSRRGSFFGGSLFTTPPEEVGDPLTESRGRKGWWGVEWDSSVSGRASRIEKRSDNEKQRSDREKSNGTPAKQMKEKLKGESQGGKEKAEKTEAKVTAKNKGVKEEDKKDLAEYPGPGKAQKGGTKTEVVDEVEVVGNGSLPVGEDKVGERTVDKQPRAETAEKTEENDDVTRFLRESKSLRSFGSSKSTKESQGSSGPGRKRWSLMIPRKSTPEQMQMPSKKFTEDVAGPRFEAAKEPEGERCAGDYPPIYVDVFVSIIPSHTSIPRDALNFVGGNQLYSGESVNPRGNSTFGA